MTLHTAAAARTTARTTPTAPLAPRPQPVTPKAGYLCKHASLGRPQRVVRAAHHSSLFAPTHAVCEAETGFPCARYGCQRCTRLRLGTRTARDQVVQSGKLNENKQAILKSTNRHQQHTRQHKRKETGGGKERRRDPVARWGSQRTRMTAVMLSSLPSAKHLSSSASVTARRASGPRCENMPRGCLGGPALADSLPCS